VRKVREVDNLDMDFNGFGNFGMLDVDGTDDLSQMYALGF